MGELRQTAKKYQKYLREFKTELDLTTKDFEQFTKIKVSINQFEQKCTETQQQISANNGVIQRFQTEISQLRQRDMEIRQYEREVGQLKFECEQIEAQ